MNASKRTAKSGTRGVTLRTAGLSLRLDVRGAVVGLLLIAVALVMGVVLIGTGDFPIAPADVVRTLFGNGTVAQDFIVNELRLPRVLVGLLVGAALGQGGAIFQSISRNPLGSPDVIGLGQGAAAGALTASRAKVATKFTCVYPAAQRSDASLPRVLPAI
ncbi:iron chelate uptake ABC transporter family permease subunit, partial [Streptomyces asiaticus]